MGAFDSMNKRFRKTIGLEMKEDAAFVSLKTYLENNKKCTELVAHGFIITNGKYGKSVAVVVDDETFVSLPSRCVEEFENMTDEQLELCLNGHLALANFEKVNAKQGATITFEYKEV